MMMMMMLGKCENGKRKNIELSTQETTKNNVFIYFDVEHDIQKKYIYIFICQAYICGWKIYIFPWERILASIFIRNFCHTMNEIFLLIRSAFSVFSDFHHQKI